MNLNYQNINKQLQDSYIEIIINNLGFSIEDIIEITYNENSNKCPTKITIKVIDIFCDSISENYCNIAIIGNNIKNNKVLKKETAIFIKTQLPSINQIYNDFEITKIN